MTYIGHTGRTTKTWLCTKHKMEYAKLSNRYSKEICMSNKGIRTDNEE